MISIYRTVTTVLILGVCLVMVVGCGDTFRPTIVPVPQPGGDPGALAHAVVLSTNPTGTGTDMHVNVSGDSLAGNVPVGTNPVFLGKTPTSRAFVINGDGTLTTYLALLPTNTAINTLTLPAGAVQPVAGGAANNGNIYLANSGSNNVTFISAASNVAVGTLTAGPQPVAVAAGSNNNVYVVNNGNGTVSVFSNLDSSTVVSPITVGSQPIWATMSSDGALVFVVNQGSNNVSVIDTTSNTVIATILVGTSPNFAFYETKLKRLYVTNTGSSTLSVIKADVIPPIKITDVPLSGAPVSVTALSDGTRIYAALGGCPSGTNHVNLLTNIGSCNGNLVSVIDATSLTQAQTIQVGAGAVSIDSSSDASRVYVVSAHDITTVNNNTGKPPLGSITVSTPSISVIKTTTNSVIRSTLDPSVTTLVPTFLAPPQDPACTAAINVDFNPKVPIPCTGQLAFMVKAFP